ncbi:MAG TPA: amino acid adenylation domain-containing protein [Thermoanaerobaculia bacterium]|nr:amino acid adenylation domain-containing protein [Thermoanaerobaculia bacterium]
MTGATNVEDIYPLTPAQQGILFHCLHQPGSGVYLDQVICRLGVADGFDPALFHRTFEHVLERHPVLRSAIVWELADQPHQVVLRRVRLPLISEDWRELTAGEQQHRLADFLRRDREQGFDFSQAPLVRLALFRLAEDRYRLVLTYQHIILDAWSVFLVIRDLLAADARLRPEEARGGERPRPFRDYLSWLKRQDPAASELYWRRRLAGFSRPTSLPAAAVEGPEERAAVGSGCGRHVERLDSAAADALQAFARQHRLTLNTLALGAWAALLARYSGEEDVVFGVAVSGRPPALAGVEAMVGLFINTLPLRLELSSGQTVLAGLEEAQKRQFELLEHEHTPLVDVQRWSEMPRGTPLFESLVVFENVPIDDSLRRHLNTDGRVWVEEVDYRPQTNYPLTLLAGGGEGMRLELLFHPGRLTAVAAARLGQHLSSVLMALPEAAAGRLADLPLLSAAERQQVFVEWNDTAVPAPQPATLHELISAQALRTPEAPAVRDLERGEAFSYREMEERATLLACHLLRLGAEPESLVACCLERSAELPVALLGVLKAGAAYVPLDAGYPQERLAHMLDDSGASLLLTSEELRHSLPPSRPPEVVLGRERAATLPSPLGGERAWAAPECLAYVIYTSGSTGRPKGVQISHAAAASFLLDMRRRLSVGPGDVLLAVTSLAFDIAGLELFLPLVAGAQVVVAGPSVARSAAALLQALTESKATLLQATPATWRLLAENGWVPPAGLRLLCGGEALPRELAEHLTAGGAPLWNLYGPTETTIWSAAQPVRPGGGGIPIGRPISATGLYVLDSLLRLVPIGVAGDLYISGAGLARGYRGRPEQTAERFLPMPWGGSPGDRLYRTGDVARLLEDGSLEYLGRSDHQIKLRGYRIELGEIEAVLGEHPEVAQAVVQPEETADGERRLSAYVVRRRARHGGSLPTAEQVARWQGVWSSTYGNSDEALAGWASSYTGHPIPAAEMEEWVEQTVGRILGLKPRRLLEIGCGTGLLLEQLAGRCDECWGTDFAAEALARTERALPPSLRSRVRLLQRPADDFSGFATGSFDAVVLNSVAQYFPDVDYLLAVLEGALSLVASPGFIFLGDLRNLRLLEAFHASVQLHRAPPALPAGEIRRRVRRAVVGERELLIDPALFEALRARWPRIGRSEVRLRRGRASNEMTRFRYDAILHVGPADEPVAASCDLDWEAEGLSLPALRLALCDASADLVRVGRIPNARLTAALASRRLIAESDAQVPASQLRRELEKLAGNGVEPEDLWALAEGTGTTAEVGWCGSGGDGCCEALYHRASPTASAGLRPAASNPAGGVQPWESYVNPPSARPDNELASELQRFAAQRVPSFMVPAGFAFLEDLPLTPNLKVDRRALRRLAPAESTGEPGAAPARTPTEEILTALWSKLLGVAEVGAHDNFFLLGGHSLLAVQLCSRLRGAFGIDLPVGRVFEAATLSQLAELVDVSLRGGPAAPPVTAVGRGGSLPISFAQERIWALEQIHRDSGAYHISVAAELAGPLRPPLLAASLGEVICRHEALRTAFVLRSGTPQQVVVPPARWPLPLADLSALPAAVRAAEVARLAALWAVLPFNLALPPLLRGCLLKMAAAEHVFLLTLHHIVSDGWSMNILLREALVVYEALTREAPPALPPLPVQYPDFALWQRSWLQGEVLEREIDFWRARLSGAPLLLDLPADRPRPATLSDRGGACVRRLSPELTDGLRALCRREGATLFMALLTAFYSLLHWLTGQTDLVVGTDTANRNRIETEGLIGFFVNQLVLRTDLSGNPTFAGLLSRVRATTLEAFAHEDLPFNALVAALNPPRRASHSPVVQVKLVLQSFPPAVPEGSSLALRPLPPVHVAAQLDLLLNVIPEGDSLAITAEYARDLFEPRTVERWLERLEHLLEMLAARPETRLDTAGEGLTETDRRLRREQERGLEAASLQRLQTVRRRVG